MGADTLPLSSKLRSPAEVVLAEISKRSIKYVERRTKEKIVKIPPDIVENAGFVSINSSGSKTWEEALVAAWAF
ncbi:MAG: hypothetical protein ACQEP5_00935 [Actinomycetota bacterium]